MLTKTINNLFDALYECNLSDTGLNDFPVDACKQDNAYGHIANAIKALGFEKEYDAWTQTGDRPQLVVQRSDETNAVIKALLEAGYTAFSDEIEINLTTNFREIAEQLDAYGEGHISFTKDNPNHRGWIWFILSNDGEEQIADYTTSLEHIVDSAWS